MFTFQPLPVAASIVLLALFGGTPESTPTSPAAPEAFLLTPPCQVDGPNPILVGQATTYNSFYSGTNYLWHFTTNTAGAQIIGSATQQSVLINTSQPGFFRLQIDLITPTGPADCAAEVNVLAGGCLVNGPNPICAGQQVTYTSAFPGTNYLWGFTSNTAGATFCGPVNEQSVCVDTTQAGAFRLELNYQQGGASQSCAAEVIVRPALSIADLTPQNACAGDNVVFATSVTGGNGPYAFVWTFDNGSGPAVIVGETTNTLSLTGVALANSGNYCVTVTGECGSEQSCAQLAVESCKGEEFCTLTQGAYGSAGGYFNGLSTIDLLNGLLATDLVVGKQPGRSLTIQAGNGACVIARLPGNSSPATLPAIGDAVLNSSTCQTSPVALPLKNSKFKNVLLGQVITLSLNTRLDPALSGLGICEIMTTQLMDDGPDGLHGTPDDFPSPGPDGIFGTADDQLTVTIPSDVFTALAAQSLPLTVGGLLELANRALAAQATDVASLSEINQGVDAINRGFDECRLLIDCHSK